MVEMTSLLDYLAILEDMFYEKTPAFFLVRLKKNVDLFYGFLDTSGKGLWIMFQGKYKIQSVFRLEAWSTTHSSEWSSN